MCLANKEAGARGAACGGGGGGGIHSRMGARVERRRAFSALTKQQGLNTPANGATPLPVLCITPDGDQWTALVRSAFRGFQDGGLLQHSFW